MSRQACCDEFLTYMSIRDEIKRHIASGELMELRHAIPGIRNERTIVISREVSGAIDIGRWSGRNRQRLARLCGDLDRFIGGDRVSVMLLPRPRPATAYLKRLAPVTENVWEIRSCDPRPGIRVLGRFSEPNVFIGLAWDFREHLRGSSWHQLQRHCLDEWQRLFTIFPAYHGQNANDYVSNSFSV